MFRLCLINFCFGPAHQHHSDINECEEDGACDEGYRCDNIEGSYECIAVVKIYPTQARKKVETCTPGFRRHNDQCVDIDECAADKNACDSNQVCTNEIGGFRCDCKIGFNLDTITNACVGKKMCSCVFAFIMFSVFCPSERSMRLSMFGFSCASFRLKRSF
uniref:EGF-like domain-containing protein n=1 Tax=Anopheles maculatus TaxID=74869 RepID=A0A182T5B0_9DIPT